jgi:hypothetical protein
MFKKVESWSFGRTIERKVRGSLEPYILQTVELLKAQTVDGIPAAAPATLVGLLFGPQETPQEPTGAPETPFEAEDGLRDADAENVQAFHADEATTQEPDPAEVRAALAATLRRPEPAPADFAQMLLAARGAGWE